MSSNQAFSEQQSSGQDVRPPNCDGNDLQAKRWLPGRGLYRQGKTRAGNAVVVVVIVVVVVFVLLAVGGVLVALLLPAVGAARESARKMSCSNNLKQIGLAMHTYHETYKTLPPAYIPDAEGKPMHSWRTALLPFIEHDSIYNQYDFHQAWNSAANLEVVREAVVPFYACPSDSVGTATKASYLMVTGPNTVGDGAKARRFRDFKNGTAATIIVVEVRGISTHWAEPTDITVEQLKQMLADESSGHAGGTIHALFADGAVQELTPAMVDQIDALTTLRSNE